MSYLYDKLKEALGGEKVVASKNTVISGWSPNNIKAIIITRNGIIVSAHAYLLTKGSYVSNVHLDSNLVEEDLETINRTNYGKPKLNTLLTRRSLSCLEEIYIDSAFMNYPRVIDLLSYVTDLTGSGVSRLRYFGYINVKSEYALTTISMRYTKNMKNIGYSLAKDSERENLCVIQYKDVGNENWYKNYNLRPQYYKIDSEKSNLAMHFRKVDDTIEKGISQEKDNTISVVKESAIKTIVGFDENNSEYLDKVIGIMQHISRNKNDSISKILGECFSKVISQDRTVKGLSEKDVSTNNHSLFEFYKKCNVFDKNSSNDISIEDLKGYLDSKKGFLDIPKLVDDILYMFVDKLRKKGYSDLVGMSLTVVKDALPECKITEELGISARGNSLQGLFYLLGELIGEEV